MNHDFWSFLASYLERKINAFQYEDPVKFAEHFIFYKLPKN